MNSLERKMACYPGYGFGLEIRTSRSLSLSLSLSGTLGQVHKMGKIINSYPRRVIIKLCWDDTNKRPVTEHAEWSVCEVRLLLSHYFSHHVLLLTHSLCRLPRQCRPLQASLVASCLLKQTIGVASHVPRCRDSQIATTLSWCGWFLSLQELVS